MGFVKISICLILLILAVTTYLIIDHCRKVSDNAWKIITTQKLPDFIQKDKYLLQLFSNKMKERKYSKISIANLLYAYLSPKGKMGDTSWNHFEELCSMAVGKIPEEKRDKITAIVSIASGGAFIGPIIANILSISRKKVYPVHISKWSNAKTLMERAKLYNSSEEDVDLTVKKDLPEKVSFKGEHVLIVDDQACSGSTMKKCVELVKSKNPESIHTLVIASSCKTPIHSVDTVGYKGFIYMWPFGIDS